MAITIQPTRFQSTNFNPTAGLAIANSSAKNITDTISAQEEAKSLANFRAANLGLAKRKQDFVEGADERKILEEQRLLGKSNRQGILANEIANAAGGSRLDSALLSPEVQNDPRFQALAENPEALDAFKNEALAQNKRLFSDPTAFQGNVLNELLNAKDDSGNPLFDRKTANDIATQKTKELFPTLDPSIAGKLLMKHGTSKSSGVGSGTGSSGGSNRLLSRAPSELDTQEIVDNLVDNFDLDTGTPTTAFGIRFTDPGDRDVFKQDVVRFISQMEQEGIPAFASAAVLEQTLDTDGEVPFKLEKMTQAQKDAVATKAKLIMDTQFATQNTRAGANGVSSQQLFAQNVNNHNQAILNRLNPDQSSSAQRIQTLLSGLPGISPSKRLTQGVIDVDTPTATNTPVAAPASVPANITAPVADTSGQLKESIKAIKADPANKVRSGRNTRLNTQAREQVKILTDQANTIDVQNVLSDFDTAPESVTEKDVNDAIDKLKSVEGFRLSTSADMKRLFEIRNSFRRSNRTGR